MALNMCLPIPLSINHTKAALPGRSFFFVGCIDVGLLASLDAYPAL